MSQHEDLPKSEAAPIGSPRPEAPGGDTDSHLGPTRAPSSSLGGWPIVLAAGLLAGLVGFGIGEAAPRLVPPSLDLPPEIRASGSQAPLETERRMSASRDRAAALAYLGLGAALGLALGAAGGLARRSAPAAIVAAVAGTFLGGAAGAGATLALLPGYHAARAAAPDDAITDDLALALRTHGGIWVSIGAAAGLALGLGLGGGATLVRALIGGVMGAAVATVIYEFGGAIGFPLAETFRPTAVAPAPRLLAHLSVALCASAGAYWAALHLRLRRAAG